MYFGEKWFNNIRAVLCIIFKLTIIMFSLRVTNTFLSFLKKRLITFKCGMLPRFDYLYRSFLEEGMLVKWPEYFSFSEILQLFSHQENILNVSLSFYKHILSNFSNFTMR